MKINLEEKLNKFSKHWHPYIIGELNDNHIKLAKLAGEFIWHNHEHEDELFIVLSGTLLIEFRDKIEEIKPGEIIIIPKGVEHLPRTKDGGEVIVMLIEPKITLNTGNIIAKRTVRNPEWI